MTRTPDEIAAEIKGWNMESVFELRDLITELNDVTAAIAINMLTGDCRADSYVDLTELPSVEIPDDIDTAYPVWAMDKADNMLVGPSADEIEHIDSVRA